MQTVNEVRGPMDAPDWFVTRCSELSRLMSGTPKTVADGLWLELIQRGLVKPDVIPNRLHGALGWKPSSSVQSGPATTNTSSPVNMQVIQGG